MNSDIMKQLTGDITCKLTNEQDLKKSSPSSYTATISGARKVYSLFPGTVLFLGFYKNMGTLTVAVSNHEVVRYLNLKDMQKWSYSSLDKGTYIGEVYSRYGLQFEYCTQWKGESKYPVRINNKIYFKQNPIDILNGIYVPYKEIDLQHGITRPKDTISFTSDQLLEWGPTSIDNTSQYIEGAQIVED